MTLPTIMYTLSQEKCTMFVINSTVGNSALPCNKIGPHKKFCYILTNSNKYCFNQSACICVETIHITA